MLGEGATGITRQTLLAEGKLTWQGRDQGTPFPLDLALPPDGGEYVDLRPLDVEHSLTLVRMKLRNVEAAMPRIGTNRVDEEGVAIVQEWIESMTEARGYPSPEP